MQVRVNRLEPVVAEAAAADFGIVALLIAVATVVSLISVGGPIMDLIAQLMAGGAV